MLKEISVNSEKTSNTRWRHQMETVSALLDLCGGNPPVTGDQREFRKNIKYTMTSSNGNSFRVTGPLWGESTGHRWIPLTKAIGSPVDSHRKGQWRGALMFSLMCAWTIGRANSPEAVDFIYPWLVFAFELIIYSLQWCHNAHDDVSNHQPNDCLLTSLFRHWSKKTSKLRVTDLDRGIHRWPVNSPHKWPVTRKMFPFDNVIMVSDKNVCSL